MLIVFHVIDYKLWSI